MATCCSAATSWTACSTPRPTSPSSSIRPAAASAAPRDLVRADHPDRGAYHDDAPALLAEVGVATGAASGEWIGLMHLSAHGTELVRRELEAMRDEGELGGRRSCRR